MPRLSASGQIQKAPEPENAPRKQPRDKGRKAPDNLEGHKDRLALVRLLIESWLVELSAKKTKSGVAELVRLLALEKELSASDQVIREIRVSWVEPHTTESSKSE